jgi:serine/threonine protein kinase
MTDGKRRLAGRYRIDGLLSRGGMSEVHFGYDERLDRPVAVKLLRPPPYVPQAPDSPEAVEILDALDRDQKRFLREIRMTARLELAGVPSARLPTCRLNNGPDSWSLLHLTCTRSAACCLSCSLATCHSIGRRG